MYWLFDRRLYTLCLDPCPLQIQTSRVLGSHSDLAERLSIFFQAFPFSPLQAIHASVGWSKELGSFLFKSLFNVYIIINLILQVVAEVPNF